MSTTRLVAGGREASPQVTVVIVTYNSAEVILPCLESLPAALAGAPPAEVLVVDNGSVDGTVELAQQSSVPTRVIRAAGNVGYAAALNLGMSTRPGTDLLALNADVRLMPGCVAELYQTLELPHTGIAVPLIQDEIGVAQFSLRREPTILRSLGEAVLGGPRAGRVPLLGEVVADPAAYEAATVSDWATGAVWLISAECLASVGAWNESYFLYSEETEMALRARDQGFVLRLSPRAVATHLGGPVRQSPKLWGLLIANKFGLYSRRHGPLSTAAYWSVLILGEGVRAAAGDRIRRAGMLALLRPQAVAVERAGGQRFAASTQPAVPHTPAWLCFSAQDWWYHNQAHSDFQLLRRVARSRRVLLVNSIGLRMPSPGKSTQVARRIGRKVASVARLVRRPISDTPNFHVMTPVVVPLYHRPLVRKLNALLVRYQVLVVSRWLRIPRDPVIVCTIPTSWDVVAPMSRKSLVYNRSDRHSDFPESDRPTIAHLERELLQNADRVLYVSRSLMQEESEMTGRRAHFLDHGVDLDHFTRRAEPKELATIPRPRVGFFGSLDDYLVDFDLLEAVARQMPEAQLVLIGDVTRPIEGLLRMPNVHWLGYKPYRDIPAYGSGFDVALMPWRDNDWIARSNPIKMKEYLALGLPVVSVDFPEVRQYQDAIRITRGHTEFIEAVRLTLRDGGLGTPESRRRKVLGASWDARAAEIVRLAEESASESVR